MSEWIGKRWKAVGIALVNIIGVLAASQVLPEQYRTWVELVYGVLGVLVVHQVANNA